MFQKFMSLPPLPRRAILAVFVLLVCCINDEFPKSGLTDSIAVICLAVFFWAIGLVRPTFLFFYYLLRAVFRYHIFFK